MKHLKRFNESFKLQSKIDNQELEDIFTNCGLFDDFPELGWDTCDSRGSGAIGRSFQYNQINKEEFNRLCNNSKTIELYNKNDTGNEVLYYLEPVIFIIIREIDSRLSGYGLKIALSDFGVTDAYYEFVITDIDYEIKFIEEES